MNTAPFQPAYGSGQVLASSAASATVDISKNARQICATNIGANVCYVRVFAIENGAQPATTSDYPVPPGAQVLVSKGEQDKLSHISPLGTTLHVMHGEGQ
jgi:hypothetical protein